MASYSGGWHRVAEQWKEPIHRWMWLSSISWSLVLVYCDCWRNWGVTCVDIEWAYYDWRSHVRTGNEPLWIFERSPVIKLSPYSQIAAAFRYMSQFCTSPIIWPGNPPEARHCSFKFVNELGVPFFVKSNHETRLVTCLEARFLLVVLNLLNATLNNMGNVLFCCMLHVTHLHTALYVV